MSTNILHEIDVRTKRILRPQVHTAASLVPALVVERRRMYEARLAQVQAAPIRNSTRTNEAHYSGRELAESAVRQGADDHMRLPSRRGDSLYYRGGLVVDVEQINQETT
jgi:hypothetical protein